MGLSGIFHIFSSVKFFENINIKLAPGHFDRGPVLCKLFRQGERHRKRSQYDTGKLKITRGLL